LASNWEHGEILAFIQANKKEHEAILVEVDGQHKFEIIISKWRNFFMKVKSVGCSNHVRNDPACKNKWRSLVGNFKKIYDYMAITKHNHDY
jgi:hypothetical protein